MKLAAIAAGFLALLPAARLDAQGNRSLTDSEYRNLLQGGGTTVSALSEDDDYEASQEQILLLRSTIKSLTDSLAIANSEAEMFKRQSADLSLKIEALGLTDLEKDSSKLEQRLLAAVRDMRVLKQQNEKALGQLVLLSEAIQVMIKGAGEIDPAARLAVETELRKTNEILGTPAAANAEAIEATLTDGMIMDVQDRLSLIVANIGEKNGVRLGMPFQVWRDNKRIAEVRVVEVRERICGAVIQSLESEKEPVKPGDRLKVDARQ